MKVSARAWLPALIIVLIPVVTFAQAVELIPASGVLGSSCNFTTGDFGFECIPMYIAFLIKLLFGFAGGICLSEMIYSGYQIALGGLKGGDTSAPRGRILWALMGLLVCIFSFLIVDTVLYALAR